MRILRPQGRCLLYTGGVRLRLRGSPLCAYLPLPQSWQETHSYLLGQAAPGHGEARGTGWRGGPGRHLPQLRLELCSSCQQHSFVGSAPHPWAPSPFWLDLFIATVVLPTPRLAASYPAILARRPLGSECSLPFRWPSQQPRRQREAESLVCSHTAGTGD